MKPMTIWSPCRGRAEISRKVFKMRYFVKSNELEASKLWDVEMVRVRGEAS